MKILYLDCFSGISGDMVLGALIDSGLKIDILRRELAKLGLKGYRITTKKVMRGGLAGTKFDVLLDTKIKSRHSKSLKEILNLIDNSALEPRVKKLSTDIFHNLAKAETIVHAEPGEDLHFHELGDMDSIIDIVGAAIGINKLRIERVYSSILPLGRGTVNTRGGILPLPAPATVELLKGFPVKLGREPDELVTPTGAGIVTALAHQGEIPEMRIESIGYGAGSRCSDDVPNMMRVIIGQACEDYIADSVIALEANIDDMLPLNYEHLFKKLFDAGALDVYLTPIQMKKSRPAVLLTVLFEEHLIDRVTGIIFSETTTFGVRYHREARKKLNRRIVKVKTKYGECRVKIGESNGAVKIISPEYEDCKKIAERKSIPLWKVYDEAKKIGIANANKKLLEK